MSKVKLVVGKVSVILDMHLAYRIRKGSRKINGALVGKEDIAGIEKCADFIFRDFSQSFKVSYSVEKIALVLYNRLYSESGGVIVYTLDCFRADFYISYPIGFGVFSLPEAIYGVMKVGNLQLGANFGIAFK